MSSIVESEGVVGGKPRVEGTRVQVDDVVGAYREWDWSIERIASEYDLTVPQVLDGLKYYYKNMSDFPADYDVEA